MKAAEVQERLGLGKTKVYDMMASGQLPVIELGPRSKRVPEAALEQWIRDNTTSPEETIH